MQRRLGRIMRLDTVNVHSFAFIASSVQVLPVSQAQVVVVRVDDVMRRL